MQNRLNGGQCFGFCLRAFLLASAFRVSGLGGQRHIALRFRAFLGLGFVVHVLRRAFILNPTPYTLACARGGWGEATTRKPSSLKRGLGFRVPVLRIFRMLRRRSTRISDRSDSSPRPFARNSQDSGCPPNDVVHEGPSAHVPVHANDQQPTANVWRCCRQALKKLRVHGDSIL